MSYERRKAAMQELKSVRDTIESLQGPERLAALLDEMFNLEDDMTTRDEAAWLLARGVSLPDSGDAPRALDLDAIEAAFITYWKDFGNARQNLTAAIREYLRVVDARPTRGRGI